MQFLPKYQVLWENKFHCSLPLKSKATMSNSNIYSDEKCCLSSLHKMMATSHVGLLSTWNVTSVTEQLNFNLILISHVRPMAIIMEKHKIKKKSSLFCHETEDKAIGFLRLWHLLRILQGDLTNPKQCKLCNASLKRKRSCVFWRLLNLIYRKENFRLRE